MIKNIENFRDKTFLITGGTGTLGKSLAAHILSTYNPKKVIIFSRDELKQFEMQTEQLFIDRSDKMRFFIGDVRDKSRLVFAMRDVDYVIHAAALKQVPATEYNPFEAVKTNIIGAQNIIEASLECEVRKVIALSTDKAAAPINLYGATKLTSDKLFLAGNYYKGTKDIKFSVVRYGNVLGSRGSVVPYFLSKIKDEFTPITDKKMTRFTITLPDAVEFVTKSLMIMKGGEMFVPKIPSYRITDLAEAILPKKKIKIVGIRPGEKLHEEMLTSGDSINTIEYKDRYVLLSGRNKINKYNSTTDEKGIRCTENFSYNSKNNKHFLSQEELRNLIISHVPGAKELINAI